MVQPFITNIACAVVCTTVSCFQVFCSRVFSLPAHLRRVIQTIRSSATGPCTSLAAAPAGWVSAAAGMISRCKCFGRRQRFSREQRATGGWQTRAHPPARDQPQICGWQTHCHHRNHQRHTGRRGRTQTGHCHAQGRWRAKSRGIFRSSPVASTSSPDLSRIKLGPPIELFNGTNLDGWEPVEPKAINGWHADQGLLINTQPQDRAQPKRSFANLRTVAEFEDFSLDAETRVPKNGNSGIYIRGRDEVQIFDSYGKPLDAHNMGAIYSRITSYRAAEKPAGEWQTVDILYVAQHVTVVLNGTKIIDNQPVLGPTGGALWPEMDRPGPIYLQGDHTGIEYRNLVLQRRVVSE